MTQPITGSFTHVFDDAQAASLIEAYGSPVATVTVRYRAKWWKRPWLWIRRKPTLFEWVYEDVQFSPIEIREDGSVSVDFTGPAA